MFRTKPAYPPQVLFQGKKKTGSVMLTSWKVRSAFLVEESLLKAREGEYKTEKGGDDFKRI